MKSFHYQNKQLYCDQVSLAEIAAEAGTPVYVFYSKTELVRRAKAYLKAVPPDSLVCYAVKANGNPTLLGILAAAGMGADVTSGGELFLAQHAGIAPDKIIFSGVGKTVAEIEAALQAGIRAIHVESEMELATIAETAARLGQVASIGVRVNPNISADTHPYISTGLHAHKFGVPPARAMQMMYEAQENRWLQPVGIAAHIGSQIRDVAPFVDSAHYLVEVADELKSAGIHLAYLDVGGGLGIDYTNEGAPAINDWSTAVGQPIAAAGYRLVMEPGRSVIGPAGALLTQVVYTKDQGEKQFIVADAGMSDLIRPTLYSAYHPVWPVRQAAGGRLAGENMTGDDLAATGVADATDGEATIDVVGPICESGDFLAKERHLPATRQGDLLLVLQAGAYGFAMSSNYNGRRRPAEVLVEGDSFRLIRRRQSYQHLLDGCQGIEE